jgi:predicted transcriptional regulator
LTKVTQKIDGLKLDSLKVAFTQRKQPQKCVKKVNLPQGKFGLEMGEMRDVEPAVP